MTETNPSVFSRVSLAISTFLRILIDRSWAFRIQELGRAAPSADKSALLPEAEPEPGQPTLSEAAVDMTPALQLLALLQREGRLVDFLQQDILGFSDAEVGVAARLVHTGCRRALDQAGRVSPLSDDVEGARVNVHQGYDARTIRLIGTVSGEPPYRGVLVHRGWRIEDFDLGRTTPGSDSTVIAPMEIEL